VLRSNILHDIKEADAPKQTPASASASDFFLDLARPFSPDHAPRELESIDLLRFGVASRARRFLGRVEIRFENDSEP
jgi:hypothetical protein